VEKYHETHMALLPQSIFLGEYVPTGRGALSGPLSLLSPSLRIKEQGDREGSGYRYPRSKVKYEFLCSLKFGLIFFSKISSLPFSSWGGRDHYE